MEYETSVLKNSLPIESFGRYSRKETKNRQTLPNEEAVHKSHLPGTQGLQKNGLPGYVTETNTPTLPTSASQPSILLDQRIVDQEL